MYVRHADGGEGLRLDEVLYISHGVKRQYIATVGP